MIPGLNALRVHNALLFLAGAFTVLAAYTNSFNTCALYAALCGFAIGKLNVPNQRMRMENKTSLLLFSPSYVTAAKCNM